ncbi:unnamed protein product [Bursaphelenchus okinawaensis]|uniref:UDP-N-acetylglucosamine transferase subunit ALG14 n=1 Tax=Bursaphelenchus okinawaensis TaxID=465554 RepID=A0A811LJ12_9BILA|nr:unnamed protein product [Bursaphelenchus okinawaensis]CAG9123275.1 unnamed protein product [Bursaphelenchus okinawaensis]
MDVLKIALTLVAGLTTFILLLILALASLYVLYRNRRVSKKPRKLLAVMGSGGHTMEMLQLIEYLVEQKEFQERTYLYYDEASRKKIVSFEENLNNKEYTMIEVPRSREVGQSYFTSIFSTLKSTIVIPSLIFNENPDLLLCNGPGTCVPVTVITFFYNLFNIFDCRIVYVESVCRVETLSLTGLILYYLRLYDAFYVQWPNLQKRYPRTDYQCRLA